jgi:hypothetical protein
MSIIQAAAVESWQSDLQKQGYQSVYLPEAAGDRPLVLVVSNLPDQAIWRKLSVAAFQAELINALADNNPKLLTLGLILDPFIDDPILNEVELPPSPLGTDVVPGNSGIAQRPDKPRQQSKPKVYSPKDYTITRIPDMAEQRRQHRKKAIKDRQRLNDAIQYAATRTKVVLEAPTFPFSADLFEEWIKTATQQQKSLLIRQLDWMWEMCHIPNVWMAVAMQQNACDPVAIYSRTKSILGNVATNAIGGDGRKPERTAPSVCTVMKSFFGQSKPQNLEQYQRLFNQVNLLDPSTSTSSIYDMVTLNPRFYETLSYRETVHASYRSISSTLPRGLLGRAVFVGHDMGEPLRILLRDAPSPIIEAHAAVFYTNLNTTNTPSHVRTFLIDSGVGILLGLLFVWSWSCYARAINRMDEVPIVARWAKAKAWAWARLVLLPVNLLLLAVMIVFTWLLSNELIRSGTWINPLPLVIGISLKGLLSSRQRHVGLVPQSFSELLTHHPDVVWQPFLIALAISIAVITH